MYNIMFRKRPMSIYSKIRTLQNRASRTFYTYSYEPTYPIKGKEPKWVDPKNAGCAFECLKSDMTVFAQGAAATPIFLLEAMTKFAKENCLKNIRVIHMHTEGKAPYTDPSCKDNFRSVSTFMGGNVRKAVSEGRADCIPLFLSEIPLLFAKKLIKIDIAVISLSPPDSRGFCTLGTSVDCVRTALKNSKMIVAQVNKKLPRTFGDTGVHISHVDYAVCIDQPLPQHPTKPATKAEARIGELVAEHLISDGCTLQMGIGNIPDSVLNSLKEHKDLGIHSEMFADGVVDLCYGGNITNRKKLQQQGRLVGSFLIGTQKLYDFVDNNNFIEMLRVEYVNNSGVISRQPNMCAINSCIEVDLTGQICSDSIGTRMYSGFGGQVDFIRGAGSAVDGNGKPIIALQAQTNKGGSKIVPVLKKGSGVVTSRAHVHYVVTEFGIASLFGKSLRQRAAALIKISHPNHRQELEKAAFNRFKVMPSLD